LATVLTIWKKIDKKKSFEENLISLCFNSGSILIDAPNMTLPLGYTTNSTYISILVAISSHKTKIKEMTDLLKIDDRTLATYLGRMLDRASIDRRLAFNGNKKSVYYEISDPFIRFYYKTIYPNLSDIDRGLGEKIYQMSLNSIEDSVNRGFEDVVISYLDERNQKGTLPNVFHQFRNYKVDNSELGRSIEIDVISDSLDKKTLLAGEAKFKNKNVSLSKLEHLKENVSIFASKYQHVYYFMFSKTSFSNDLLALFDPDVELISLEKMIKGKDESITRS